jgi:hypothetical protein
MAMTDVTPINEPEPHATPPPGWSNSAPDDGISSTEPPPIPIDTNVPGWSNNGPAATGAVAGAPGTWTPAGAEAPDQFTAMDSVVATPATAWTTGQYVTLGDGSEANWGGTAWVSGRA